MSNTTPLSNADELPRAVQNGMSPEEHATWMFLTDKKALDEPYTFAIKQSDLTKFITTYAEHFARDKQSTAWNEGYRVGWEECRDPDSFQNDWWDSKTINPYSELDPKPQGENHG